MVYELLTQNGLGDFYKLQGQAGLRISPREEDLGYLDDPRVLELLSTFRSQGIVKLTLTIPQIHCSACIWLLEHLDQLDDGIRSSRVNFLKKELSVVFNEADTTLRKVISLLTRIGYTPRLNLSDLSSGSDKPAVDHRLTYQLGVAAFCFGNIMLLSFPDYLGVVTETWIDMLGYLNILLSLPVLLYCGRDYLVAAYKSMRRGALGIDVPIALGMLTLFVRSCYEIITHSGSGYLDSLSGFVFFLLIGRWFQEYTFQHISFDNDYRSFFPISVLRRAADEWHSVPLNQIVEGDVIRVSHRGVIPCDGTVVKGRGVLDYSFVSGESEAVEIDDGGMVYAGGIQCGEAIDIKIAKSPDQAYLTQLWKEEIFNDQPATHTSSVIDLIGRYFTIFILTISLGTILYWLQYDIDTAIRSFTAVLIIACPCVLALSIPFIYGNMVRLLAHRGMYCKNTSVIERLTEITHVVWDKTGTITDTSQSRAVYIGSDLSAAELQYIHAVARQSLHPLSKIIARTLSEKEDFQVGQYHEHLGQGVEGWVAGHHIRIGSQRFIWGSSEVPDRPCVFVEIDQSIRGRYEFDHPLRKHIVGVISSMLDRGYVLSLLSGDTHVEQSRMQAIFADNTEQHYQQSPTDKLNYIRDLQAQGHRVLMIGDGLNDAGALRQSDVGMVVSQDKHFFSPACDIMISPEGLSSLDKLIATIVYAKYVLYGAFAFAAVYNVVGLWYAVRGALSPVIAAILMPTSSITMIVYGLVMTTWVAHRHWRNLN